MPHELPQADADIPDIIKEYIESEIERRINTALLKRNLFVPNIDVSQRNSSDPYMAYSTCSVGDMLHPSYAQICRTLNVPIAYHRKHWEWAFIMHHLGKNFLSGNGRRALGFGVGKEPLPAAMIARGFSVVATDAPHEIGEKWKRGDQFSTDEYDLPFQGIVNDETFRQKISFQECDMNNINEELVDFDFCWSSCALEHLGSIDAGLDFIANSVENTLKIGGLACHTTEFNLSSNEETVEAGETVLYRKKDLEKITQYLRARGHWVGEIRVAPDAHFLDGYVDTPPFTSTHLKLELLGYVATSVGIVVRRGES